jgi:hypothetical protein
VRIRLWGTRGSLPVALTAEQVQRNVSHAPLAANGRTFATLKEAESFAARLPFHPTRTFGGQSACVELELAPPGRAAHEHVLCDLGTGVRAFGNEVIARHGFRTPPSVSRPHLAGALGSHDGIAAVRAGLCPRQSYLY